MYADQGKALVHIVLNRHHSLRSWSQEALGPHRLVLLLFLESSLIFFALTGKVEDMADTGAKEDMTLNRTYAFNTSTGFGLL